jgi:hypothetical protein
MKKLLLLAALGLILPLAASADSIDFGNSGGTLSGSSSLSMTGSNLISVVGLNGNGPITGTDLGSVTFNTGSLMTGSLQAGGAFAPGGGFSISGNGVNGVPNGVIFSGTFRSATWTLATVDGINSYTFAGMVAGSSQGSAATGMVMDFTVDIGTGLFNGSASLSNGKAALNVVPELDSAILLGTGLLGLGGLFRRKIK